jgi:hypothetical protein
MVFRDANGVSATSSDDDRSCRERSTTSSNNNCKREIFDLFKKEVLMLRNANQQRCLISECETME